ncbi:MAG TPA: FeoB-associated Cys-rich membrane protein [Clostridiaceae bacterium]|nr:FeoB-associated Cys-rich membrane protein [Clostridiaceae bacterium]
MINWILGGLIIACVVFLVVRFIKKIAKGESTCCSGCDGCSSSCCSREYSKVQ